MKIVLTGAGGGHFYPLVAVADRIRKEVFLQKIVSPEIYFLSDAPYDERELFNSQIKFIQIPAGKLRLYPSLKTFTDIFKTAYGLFVAFREMYKLYPDVVFAKGGYSSFPVVFAARLLSIPVFIHESDTVAGRTTKWAGKFAARVAVSYGEAAKFFPMKNLALTGQPIRTRLLPPIDFERKYPEGKERKVILVLGGSQGSQRLNDAVFTALPEILEKYDVVHQVGTNNFEDVKKLSESLLRNNPNKDRYFADGFIDVALFYPKADLVITRAGSVLFELAIWQLPSIVVPIPETISRDQRSNAYAYTEKGTGVVLEENNISKSVLMSQIKHFLEDKKVYEETIKACHKFDDSKSAATTIAREIISVALSHND